MIFFKKGKFYKVVVGKLTTRGNFLLLLQMPDARDTHQMTPKSSLKRAVTSSSEWNFDLGKKSSNQMNEKCHILIIVLLEILTNSQCKKFGCIYILQRKLRCPTRVSILSPPKYGSAAKIPLLWRHNKCDGISNLQPYDCLPNRLFKRRSKKTPKPRVTGPCAGNHQWMVNSPHKWPVTRKIFSFYDVIMHCGLVTTYGMIDLCYLWLRWWLVAWQHQAIAWTNVDLSSSML